jgi:Protein of unknown function (DUF2971)
MADARLLLEEGSKMTTDLSVSPGEVPPPTEGSEPELLYHYTTPSGFRKILDSQCLWASDVWYMNDLAEGTYGRKAIARYLRHQGQSTDLDKKFCNLVLEMLANVKQKLDSGDLLNSYIACLSAKGDQLSQWRAYGHDCGVSIGFDRQALEDLGKELQNPFDFRVLKVAYKRSLQKTLLGAQYVPFAPTDSKPGDPSTMQSNALAFFQRAMELSPAMKDPAFREEREYRLHIRLGGAAYTGTVLRFRDSALGITPYIEIPLSESEGAPITVIRRVIVGPQRHQLEVRRAISQLLQVKGLDVGVSNSKVPLRA